MHAFLAEKFKETIIKDINESGLSLPTAYYVMKEVFLDLQSNYYEQAKEPPVEETTTIDIPIQKEEKEDK